MSEPIISSTAYMPHAGSHWGARRVHGLTAAERAAVRARELVRFDCGRPADGHHGTTWRHVVERGGRFYARVEGPTGTWADYWNEDSYRFVKEED